MDGDLKLSTEQEALRQYRFHIIQAREAAGRLPRVEDKAKFAGLVSDAYAVVRVDDRFRDIPQH